MPSQNIMSCESPKRGALRQALVDKLSRGLGEQGIKLNKNARGCIEIEVTRLLSLPQVSEHDLEAVEKRVKDFIKASDTALLVSDLTDIITPRRAPGVDRTAAAEAGRRRPYALAPALTHTARVPSAVLDNPRLTDQEMRVMPRKSLIQIIQLLADRSFLRKHQLQADAAQLAQYVHQETAIALYNLLYDSGAFRAVRYPKPSHKPLSLPEIRRTSSSDSHTTAKMQTMIQEAAVERYKERSYNQEKARGGVDPPWELDRPRSRRMRASRQHNIARVSAPELRPHPPAHKKPSDGTQSARQASGDVRADVEGISLSERGSRPVSYGDPERILWRWRDSHQQQQQQVRQHRIEQKRKEHKEWGEQNLKSIQKKNMGGVEPPWELDIPRIRPIHPAAKAPIPEEERTTSLRVLKEKESELLSQLGSATFRGMAEAIVRPSFKEKQNALELQLREVEQAIHRYSRPVVFKG